ncbi:Small conductance calcium-activated potassium channel protein [Aphelenchoides fujianensis]|nr:Small conductance calcium-activated potassium channel protein [Aphelenchoides fujianensis]
MLPKRQRNGRLPPKKQLSLKVSDYPILLLANNHKDDHAEAIKWTESDLPAYCSGGSSWLIGESLTNSASQQAMAADHRSVVWSGLDNHHVYHARKRGSATSEGTGARGVEDDLDGLQMLKAQHKYSLGVHPSTSTNPPLPTGRSPTGSRRGRKQQLWSLSPAAFHQSFDDRLRSSEDGALSNSCGNIDEQTRDYGRRKRRAAFCSGDTSKGAFAGGYGAGGNDSAAGLSSGNRQLLGGRSPQSSFDSNGDVGQISLNFLRANGTIAPFKTLLTSTNSNSPAAQPRTFIPPQQSSLTRDQSGNRIAQAAAANANPPIYGEFTKRKESLARPRKPSDPRVSYEHGDQLSKKSLSLVLSEDLEAQRPNDDAKTPLMKEAEKGGRLIQRQHLFHVRRSTSDYALFFALLGIVTMVVENELIAAHGSWASVAMKLVILISTFILVSLVVKFHVHEVQLFMNSNSAEDWRIAVTWRRCSRVALELLACGICPLPVDINIPMFFRLYWICRVMLLHSRLFTDASSRSIAGLNRVNFNARFILKTLMTLAPGSMLLVFTASLWIVAAWVLRLCEREHAGLPPSDYRMAAKHENYLNSLWMISITFLSVGYGDIVPTSVLRSSDGDYHGRGGNLHFLVGGRRALPQAGVDESREEIDTQLTKKLKHSAANVLRETWLIYKYRRLVEKIDPVKIRQHQRKFLVAIYAMRKVKRDQRKLAENSVSLGDVAKTCANSYELVHDIHGTQEGLALRMTSVEHQLSDIQRELGALAELIRGNYKRSSVSNSNYDPDHSPVESLRRRRGQQPLVDVS